MKTKLMLASMILLASLSASAQKIYTGRIETKKAGYTVFVDRNQNSIQGKQFMKDLAFQLYGKDVLKTVADANLNEKSFVIGFGTDTKVENDYKLAQAPKAILAKTDLVVLKIMTKVDGMGSDLYDYYLVNTKEKTAYSLDYKKTVKIKI